MAFPDRAGGCRDMASPTIVDPSATVRSRFVPSACVECGRRRIPPGVRDGAQVGAQPYHPIARPKAATQQSMLVQLLKPLGILHIGFAARDMLDVARIHEQD